MNNCHINYCYNGKRTALIQFPLTVEWNSCEGLIKDPAQIKTEFQSGNHPVSRKVYICQLRASVARGGGFHINYCCNGKRYEVVNADNCNLVVHCMKMCNDGSKGN